MAIVLDGTSGITTPALDSTARFATADMPLGSVIQVVSVDYATAFSSSSTSPVDVSGFAASITPTSATSKILVFVTVCFGFNNDSYPYVLLERNGTAIGSGTTATGNQVNTFLNGTGPNIAGATIYAMTTAAKSFLDSPATTSALTYQIRFAVPYGGPGYINRPHATDNAVYIQRPTSSITVMEIAA
jgi:hypothetical protein